ncbi:hypothetical protein P7C70_g208, partial [Phenoliferia sp. Uapishka_3]
MESLSGIGSALPPEVAEAQLAHAFRGAALSLTALFKAGKKSTQKAYLAGKREALQDVLEFIQASLDHPPSATAPGQPAVGPLNVARLIDYLCARQETLKAEEEGEDDDTETVRPSRPPPAPAPRPTACPVRATSVTQSPSLPAVAAALRSSLQHATTPAPPPPGASTAGPRDSHHPPSTSPVASSSSSPSSSHPSFQYHRGAQHSTNPPYSSSSSLASTSSTSAHPFVSTQLSSPIVATGAGAHASFAIGSTGGGGNGAAPIPLTRLQARRDREHRDKDHRRGSRSGSGPSGGASSVGSVGGTGHGESLSAGALKRRWGAVALTEVDLDEADDRSTSPGREEEDAQDGGTEDAMDLGVMEMAGWDGVGERPLKRAARRA